MLMRFALIIGAVIFLSAASSSDYMRDIWDIPKGKDITDGWVDLEQEQEKLRQKTIFEKYAAQYAKTDCGRITPLRIGTLRHYPPFFWEEVQEIRDGIGVLTKYYQHGMNLDFIKYLMTEIGKTQLEYIPYNSFSEMEKALQRGELDIVPGLYYNPDPDIAIEYIFPAFLTSHIIAATYKQPMRIRDFHGLAGHSGISQLQEGLMEAITFFKDNNPDIRIFFTESSYRSIYSTLMAGGYDYFLTNLYVAQALTKTYGIDDRIFFTIPLRQQRFFLALSKNSDCRILGEYFTEYLKTPRDDELNALFYHARNRWLEMGSNPIEYQNKTQTPNGKDEQE